MKEPKLCIISSLCFNLQLVGGLPSHGNCLICDPVSQFGSAGTMSTDYPLGFPILRLGPGTAGVAQRHLLSRVARGRPERSHCVHWHSPQKTIVLVQFRDYPEG